MRGQGVLYIAVEDELSEAVTLAILRQCGSAMKPFPIRNRGGAGHLRRKIEHFNVSAQGMPFFVLTDLDQYECPPGLLADWLKKPQHPNLIFRVAVREVEAWVMADREAFADFLGLARELVPSRVEEIADPKRFLVGLAAKSRRTNLRRDLVPFPGSTATVGRNYNGALGRFVTGTWNALGAAENSDSLRRAIRALGNFPDSTVERA